MPWNHIFLVEAIDYQITCSEVPSKKHFLSVIFYNLQIVKLNLHKSAAFVVDECLIFGINARITTQQPFNIIKNWKSIWRP